MNAIGLVLLSSGATATEVAAWALAVRGQLRNHVAPSWGLPAPVLTLYEGLQDVPPDVPLIAILDDSDHAGALGYHSETPDGRAYGRVFLRDAQLEGSAPSTVLSHEACEMMINPDVNGWSENEPGELWAKECSDPVQDDAYLYRGVLVSNFVLSSYFDPHPVNGNARYDWLGRLSGPFTLSAGGYAVVRSGGALRQVFASGRAATHAELEREPMLRARSKRCPASRTERLLRGPKVADD